MEKQYLDALEYVLTHGTVKSDRTGVGTISTFGLQQRYDLTQGFPAVTTKKLAWRAVVGELLWFLEGSQDERRLAEITFEKDREDLIGKNTIWTANADKQGKALGYNNTDLQKNLGPIYGAQWRNFNQQGIDQISWIINELKTNPSSRRIILTAWNPAQLDDMALPPCHIFSQFYVENGKLSCQLYQRSADMFLGVPFNIASYSLLTHMIAHVCDLEVGEFIHVLGDAHIYSNHVEQVKQQLTREPLPLPKLVLNPNIKDIDKFTISDIELHNYVSHEAIRAEMAV